MRKNRLNDVIRAKIAVQLTLNKTNTHQEIADFYGISRQLVTLVAKERGLQRTKTKGTEGPDRFPKRTMSDFVMINNKFSEINASKLKDIVNEDF